MTCLITFQKYVRPLYFPKISFNKKKSMAKVPLTSYKLNLQNRNYPKIKFSNFNLNIR